MNKIYLIILIVTYIIITIITVFLSNIMALKENVQSYFLYNINTVLAVLSFITYYIHKKAVTAKNNYQFTSKTLSITLIRMSAIIITIVCYVLFSKRSINIFSLIYVFFIYFIYNFLELYFLMKEIRQIKNQIQN